MKKLNPSLLESRLTSRMERDLAEHNLSGASLLVFQDGETDRPLRTVV